MSTSLLCFFLLLSLLSATPCLAHHVININSSTPLQFSSLAWDPVSHHFVVRSSVRPAVYGILDNGMIRCLISEPPSNRIGVSAVTTAAVDHIHRRLIVAFLNPSSIVAYDLKSHRKIYAMPLPELDMVPPTVSLWIWRAGTCLLAARSSVLLKVAPRGDRKKVIIEFKIFGDQGLSGIAFLSHGYILPCCRGKL